MERLGSEAERYLRIVVSGLPIWRRSELQEELRGHLGDSIRRRVEAGVDPAVAEAEALAAFGPAEELRREILRVHRPALSPRAWLDRLADGIGVVLIGPLRPLLPALGYHRDYALGRYDAIIVRGEHELRVRGPRVGLHHELGLAYNAIREYDAALRHLEAELDWLRQHPLPRIFGRSLSLATAYSNLAGVLESLGRHAESAAAVEAGLAEDGSSAMLHLQRARQLAREGNGNDALRHLEAVFADRRARDLERLLLLFSQDPSFADIRDDPRFQRVLLRAAAS